MRRVGVGVFQGMVVAGVFELPVFCGSLMRIPIPCLFHYILYYIYTANQLLIILCRDTMLVNVEDDDYCIEMYIYMFLLLVY